VSWGAILLEHVRVTSNTAHDWQHLLFQ